MSQTYSQFESYQDTGYVDSIHKPGRPDESHSRLNFSTKFRRPNLFRFEWQNRLTEESPALTSVIWCDGESAYKKYGHRQAKKGKSLEAVIAGATAGSKGTAHTAPALLLTEVSGRKLTEQGTYTYVGIEPVAGEDCHRLHHQAPHEIDLWISESRTIVLRVFEQFVVGEEPKPSKWLHDQAFKSLPGFIRWLRMRREFAWAEKQEPFHVIEQTHYTSVILDANIPDSAFSLAGYR